MKYIKSINENKTSIQSFSLKDWMNYKPSYKEKVISNIKDIVMKEKRISEKDFNKLNKMDEKLEKFYKENKSDLDIIIKEFESSNKRSEYCSEKIYDDYNNILGKLDKK